MRPLHTKVQKNTRFKCIWAIEGNGDCEYI